MNMNVESESKVASLLNGALSLEEALGVVDEMSQMDGLGAITLQNRIAAARRIQKASIKRAQTDVISKNASRGQQIMIARRDTLGADIARAIDTGELQFTEGDVYQRTVVSGGNGSLVELILSSNERTYGVSSFDKTQLPTGMVLAVEKIHFGWGQPITPPAINPADVYYVNTIIHPVGGFSIPLALLNSDLIIGFNETVVAEIPVARFITPSTVATSGNAQGYEDSVKLNQIKILKDKTNIYMRLRTPVGLTLPANTYVEVRLMGDMLRPKSLGY